MTAIDPAGAARHAPSALRRIANVVKLHFTNPTTIVWMPLGILGLIFLLNWLIWLAIYTAASGADRADATEGTQWSGASLFVFVYMLVVAVQAMNLTFPLALGYGATRRDYYLGSALTFVALAAGWSVLLGLLGVVEEATNGWGLGGSMFAPIYFGDDPLARVGYVFLLMLFFFFVGAATGAMYVRWKQYGIIGFFAGLGILLVGAVALLVVTDGWAAVGDAFGAIGIGGAYALSLVPTALAGVAGFALLRRATPRS